MVFIGKHTRVCSNNKYATVACGTHGTIINVDRNPRQRNAKYTVLWDNYNFALFIERDEFQLLNKNSKEIYQEYTQRIDTERIKQRKIRKNVFTSFWKMLDDENLWHHFHAVQARNIVPVGESDAKSKLILETFRLIENEDRISPPNIKQNVLLLPATGSEVRSLNCSTVLAGLFGVITNTKCLRGGATIFYILWKGYFHSINYTLNEFVVTKYAGLTENGQDPNKSLKVLALSLCEPSGVSVTTKHYCEENAKVAFDNSRRPGHVVFKNEF